MTDYITDQDPGDEQPEQEMIKLVITDNGIFPIKSVSYAN